MIPQNENHAAEEEKLRLIDNILSKNPLLALGIAVSPAVLYADTLKRSLVLAAFFSLHSFLTLIISSFIPKNIVYMSRVILYTLISALMFTALNILSDKYFFGAVSSMGFIGVILIINPLIISRSELEFFHRRKGIMILDIISSLAGYSAAVIITGFFRELISTGGIDGRLYGTGFTLPALSETFGGLLFLGLFAAFIRLVTGTYTIKKDRK